MKYIKGAPVIEKDKRTITINFSFPARDIRVHGMYAPAEKKEREAFWRDWTSVLATDPRTEKIIIGDFNAYSNVQRDTWSKEVLAAKRASPQYSKLMENTNLVDAHPLKNPGKKEWTFRRIVNNETEYTARIDAALISSSLSELVTRCKIKGFNDITTKPDHKPVLISLNARELGYRVFVTPNS